MRAAVRRGLRGPDRLACLLERGIVGSRAAPAAALADKAEEFADQYPKVKVTVNGKEVQVPEGSSILTACRAANAYVSVCVCVCPLLLRCCLDGNECMY